MGDRSCKAVGNSNIFWVIFKFFNGSLNIPKAARPMLRKWRVCGLITGSCDSVTVDVVKIVRMFVTRVYNVQYLEGCS